MKLNEIIQGDNLQVMKDISSESIDLIYLDPPFFTQRDWTKDDNSFSDKFKDMNEYIDFMSVRLKEMYRILKSAGSIYLHCDYHASHYLKVEMDEIFGINNFQNEIIWHYTKMNNSTKNWISNFDSILYYSKSDKFTFNIQYSNETSALYERLKHIIDKDNKLRWNKAKTIKQQLLDSYINSTKKRLGRELQNEDIIIDFEDKGKKKCDNVWYISILKGNSNEYCNYPTQKPIILLERIILASSNKNDTILDPFCGSGTTCVAAKKLSRNYIGIDQSKDAVEITKSRIKKIMDSKEN